MNIYPRKVSVGSIVLCGLISLSVLLGPGSSGQTPGKTHKTQSVSEALAHEGKDVFRQHNCANCHSIDNKGGCLAPPLDGIQTRRPKKFILARITDSPDEIAEFSRLYPRGELMPHPRLSPADAKKIAAYLLTLAEPEGGFVAHGHRPRQQPAPLPASHLTEKDAGQSSASGKALFYSHGCVACHSIGHIGGQFAPALDGISKHRDLDFVISRINAAEFLNARGSDEYQERGVVMPPSNLSEKEIGHIAQFLMSLP